MDQRDRLGAQHILGRHGILLVVSEQFRLIAGTSRSRSSLTAFPAMISFVILELRQVRRLAERGFSQGRSAIRFCHPLIDPVGSTASARRLSVATDQRTSTARAEIAPAEPVIENELPTYRAISKLAIFSVASGSLAVCSFAHPGFYAFSFLAVGLGILAQRAIRRYPDMLTGRGLANAGIFLGLVSGLVTGTVSTVQYVVRKKQAEEFAKQYATILKSPDLGEILWYNSHPDIRKDKTGAQLLQDHESRPKERRMLESSMGPMAELVALRKRLTASKSEDIHFVKIERVGDDDGHGLELQIFALARYEINGPGNQEFPDKTQYALAVLKARPVGREFEWWTDRVHFPYKPDTVVAPESPVSDGHSHADGAAH
jgi:hypothetical protein